MRTRTKAIATSLGMALAFTGASATTANAYNDADLSVSDWQRYTVECPCSNNYGLDFTEFKYDSGGEGLKLWVKKDGDTVAQFEFHPSDELLYVYDGKNDGDSIYIKAFWWEEAGGWVKDEAVYGPRSTSAEIDMNVVEMDGDDDIDEGVKVYFQLFDDKAATDPITDVYEYNATA